MKIDPYLHAALVLKGAEKEITKESLLSVLKAAGAQADEAKAQVLAEAVKGINFEDLLKTAAMPVAAAPSQTQSSQPAEQKKEEKKEDAAKSEAAAAEGLAALFG